MVKASAVFLLGLAVVSAIPADPILRKLDPGLRYQYVEGHDGNQLVDLWGKLSDLQDAARFDPDRQIVYHLFTRQNPTVSQPMLIGNNALLGITNYNPVRRTIVVIHGWLDSVTSNVNSVLVPAFLSAEDVNVIVADWSAGAATINYFAALSNTLPAGQSIARFITWLNGVTGASIGNYHVIGHSLGGHAAGIVGRNLGGGVPYITALEPMFTGWNTHDHKFRDSDGIYTEVIHTNVGYLGYVATLGDADFYPNGGVGMPGCDDQDCDHARSYYYFAESLFSGGFTGTRCLTYLAAMSGNCILWGTLHMGGLVPKTGQSGIYYLETNASPPFSRG